MNLLSATFVWTLLFATAARVTFAQRDFRLDSPVDFQVFQRGVANNGIIIVSGKFPTTVPNEMSIEGKLTLTGEKVDQEWKTLGMIAGGQDMFSFVMQAPAGGWYRLDVRSMSAGAELARATVERVGVGDIFVIAGQSNSANHGSERQRPKSGLVSAFDGVTWRIANDPQPGASGGGGSFVPPFGDAMVERFQVPIGIVATGVGATSVREWLPSGAQFPNPPTLVGNVTKLPSGGWESKGTIFDKFVARLKPLGPDGFRAVLWHQGESDANQRDEKRTLSGAHYEKYLSQLIKDSQQQVGWGFPWFVAQASYHTPDNPGSQEIRSAQKALWESRVALQGPDTDALDGPMRDNEGKGVHFSGDGLRAHAASWVNKVAPWLNAELSKSSTIKVFILAGQSNMEGQGVVSMNHAEYYNGGKGNLEWSMQHSESRDRMAHLRDADGSWIERDDVEIRFKAKGEVRKGALTIGYTGYGGSSHIGPELQFGHVVGDYFVSPVSLIKTAWGGKSLHVDFRPPSSEGKTGIYYDQMVAEVRDALSELGDRPFELSGFVWMQGWNDMVSRDAIAEYDTNLVNFAKDIRTEFDSPNLPFVIGELGNGGPAKDGSGMKAFRQAQQRGARSIPNSVFVQTQAFARPRDLSPNRGHGHHWFGNAESYFLIGDALGRGVIGLLGE